MRNTLPRGNPASRSHARRAFARAGLALALAPVGSAAIAATTYVVTEAVQFVPGTATLAGGVRVPLAMNRSGKVLGGCSPCTVFDPATSTLSSVPTLADGNTLSLATGINASGQITGLAGVLGPVIRNPDGSATVLGVPPGTGAGRPLALNDQGIGVGFVRDPAFTDGMCTQRAVQWDAAGQPRLLGSLPGTTTPWSVAHGVNRLGQAVGRSAVPPAACGLASLGHAVLFTPTGPKDLHHPSLPPVKPGLSSQANAINDQGLAVGWIPTGGSYGLQVNRAIVWNTVDDTFVLVGSGALSGGLRDINNSGTVVGYEGANAMVGDAATGTWTDLNTLVPNKPANWLLRKAVAINDAGQIAVEGYDPAFGTIAFVLTPTALVAPRLAAPSNLIATPIGLSEVRLQWADNAVGETGQRITRCANGSCSFIAVGANVSAYSDINLAIGITYTYQVQALLTGADSPLSNTASVLTGSTTPPTAPPLPPTDLFAYEPVPGQVSVRWIDAANNESSFGLYRCQGIRCASFSLIASLGVNTTNFVDSTVRRGTAYTYKVRAGNAVGNSPFSSPWSVTTQP